MKQEALLNFQDIYLTVIAMVLFIVTFSLITWRAYRKSNKALFKKMANLPLEESSHGQQ